MQQAGDILGAIVRPVIALIFAGTACYAFIIDKLNTDQWIGLALMVLAFYFAAKTAENATAAANKRAPNRSTDVNIEGNVNTVEQPRNNNGGTNAPS